jgi:hypothetical protein
MRKISTLFKKDPNDLGRVINEINPENEWAFSCGIPTRKFDGSAMMILNGELYKRYDVKSGKEVPAGAIPCQEPDPITGHWPHWIKCNREDPSDKYAFEAFDKQENWNDATYELCGEKVNKNRENIIGHELILHGVEILPISDFSFNNIREYLSDPLNDIEGIVFHVKDDSGRMCKIRKKDFGVKR